MSRTDRILLAAILAFGAWMFVSPMGIASGDAYRDNDWFTDRAMDAMARDALLHHHQLPIRSHLVGGGFPTVGHPFDGSWSPTILPVLLFGDVIGVKVNLLLLLLLGSWGIWGLARSWLGLGPPAAALSTLGFAFSGWLPSMMLVGFYPQCLFLVTPAILRLLWVEDRRRPRSLILAGFLLFLLLQQAGNAVLAVAFFVALATWLERDLASRRKQGAGTAPGPADHGPARLRSGAGQLGPGGRGLGPGCARVRGRARPA